MADATAAIEMDPNDIGPYSYRAFAYAFLNKPAESKADIEKIAGKDKREAADVEYRIAYKLVQDDNCDAAREHATRATEIHANDAENWFMLERINEKSADFKAALDNINKIEKIDPKFFAAQRLGFRRKFVKNALAGVSDKASKTSEDYFYVISSPATWKHHKMPLKVFVVVNSKVPGYRPSFAAQVDRALASWEEVLAGKLSFSKTSQESAADIVLRWGPVENFLGGKLGHTECISSGADIRKANITLSTKRVQADMTDQRMLSIATHELGHALGIGGHSTNSGDVMFFTSLATAPSERDKRTIRKLYDVLQQEIPVSGTETSIKDADGAGSSNTRDAGSKDAGADQIEANPVPVNP